MCCVERDARARDQDEHRGRADAGEHHDDADAENKCQENQKSIHSL
jgi:hypothetical protein